MSLVMPKTVDAALLKVNGITKIVISAEVKRLVVNDAQIYTVAALAAVRGYIHMIYSFIIQSI